MSVNLGWQVLNLRLEMCRQLVSNTRAINTGSPEQDLELFIKIVEIVAGGTGHSKGEVAAALADRGDEGIKDYGEDEHEKALQMIYSEFENTVAPSDLKNGVA